MNTYVIIYDIERAAPTQFKSHYRIYDTNKDLVAESDCVYTIEKLRKMMPAELRSKITTCIKQKEYAKHTLKRGASFKTSCLVSPEVLKIELEDIKPVKEQPAKVVKDVVKRIEVEDNPRIFKVVLINGNYTIVKSESRYLTREQAKEELFARQLEEA